MDMLNSDKMIAIELHPAVREDLERQLTQVEQMEQGGQGQYAHEDLSVTPEERELPKGMVVMDGNDLAYINPERVGFEKDGMDVKLPWIKFGSNPQKRRASTA